jgi:hypothetical protein
MEGLLAAFRGLTGRAGLNARPLPLYPSSRQTNLGENKMAYREKQIDQVIAAGAYGLAAFYLQNAMLTILVAKGHLTMKEGALTIEGAINELDQNHANPSPGDLGSLAKAALTTLSQGWASQARGN